MNEDFVAEMVRQVLVEVALVAGPFLAVAVIVGLVVGVLQAATQIQEQTLTFVPKLGVLGVCIVFGGPWALGKLIQFTDVVLQQVANLAPRGLL